MYAAIPECLRMVVLNKRSLVNGKVVVDNPEKEYSVAAPSRGASRR